MCNEINLEELEALANAAGGVKWIACGPSYGEAKPAFLDEVNVDDDEYPEAVCQYPAGCRSDVSDKMAYIAEANPATLLSLLDRLKSAEAERDALAARCKEHEQFRHQHRDCDNMGVENQQLRLRLAELEGQEPVAIVCDTYELRWIGCGPIASIISKHQIKVGDSLYARPVPAVQSQDAIDAKRYRALRCGQAWSVIDWIGDTLRGEALDAAIDAREAQQDNPRANGD